MKEHPMLFSAPMVRAILNGRKTQTRRVVKPQPTVTEDLLRQRGAWIDGESLSDQVNAAWQHGFVDVACSYGRPGDRLWVRETWAVQRHEPCLPHERDYQDLHSPVIRYLADGDARRIPGNLSTGEGIYHGAVEKTRVSIHMPRWASRISLEITDVRVQRLQDITDADALDEGVYAAKNGSYCDSPRVPFHILWDSINEKRGFGWDANPWVWALTFKRVEQPA